MNGAANGGEGNGALTKKISKTQVATRMKMAMDMFSSANQLRENRAPIIRTKEIMNMTMTSRVRSRCNSEQEYSLEQGLEST